MIKRYKSGDHDWTWTNDFFHVKEVLYQLSYAILFKYRYKSKAPIAYADAKSTSAVGSGD
mgnify:CR=1 FL=1